MTWLEFCFLNKKSQSHDFDFKKSQWLDLNFVFWIRKVKVMTLTFFYTEKSQSFLGQKREPYYCKSKNCTLFRTVRSGWQIRTHYCIEHSILYKLSPWWIFWLNIFVWALIFTSKSFFEKLKNTDPHGPPHFFSKYFFCSVPCYKAHISLQNELLMDYFG